MPPSESKIRKRAKALIIVRKRASPDNAGCQRAGVFPYVAAKNSRPPVWIFCAASAAKSPARPKGPAIAHFAKCVKCAKCGSRAAKLDCAFTMCQQCCFEAHPGDCPAHAKAAGKKREEEELLALLYATAAPAAAQPPKPRVEHYEEALESVGDTVTLFCLADFLRSRHRATTASHPFGVGPRNVVCFGVL